MRAVRALFESAPESPPRHPSYELRDVQRGHSYLRGPRFAKPPTVIRACLMPERHLRDPDLRRLRALKMIDLRIHGKTVKEVAEEMGVSEKTVIRTISWAKKAELVVKAEDKILAELVPAAHDAFKRALNAEDPEVAFKAALEIFKGTLPSFAKRPQGATGASSGTNNELSSYIEQLRSGLIADGEVLGSETSLPAGSPQRQITAGEAETSQDGLSAPAEGDESAVVAPRDASDSE